MAVQTLVFSTATWMACVRAPASSAGRLQLKLHKNATALIHFAQSSAHRHCGGPASKLHVHLGRQHLQLLAQQPAMCRCLAAPWARAGSVVNGNQLACWQSQGVAMNSTMLTTHPGKLAALQQCPLMAKTLTSPRSWQRTAASSLGPAEGRQLQRALLSR